MKKDKATKLDLQYQDAIEAFVRTPPLKKKELSTQATIDRARKLREKAAATRVQSAALRAKIKKKK